MKKNVTLIAAMLLLLISATVHGQKMNREERQKAFQHLKATQDELNRTLAGLSEAQWNFYPSEEGWSIAQCVEHIAISESTIFGIVQMTLQDVPDPGKKDSVLMSDDEVLALITNREQKVQTRPEFMPTGKFGSYQGSLEEFNSKRTSNLNFVKESKENLRSRYFDFPFGKVDSYQVILFLSGHTQRHTDQIKEIINNPDYPGS